ncbi:MAG: UDP-N-acetylglucosamine 2-epimerase (non-hydrolyzing) [Verrucomicrobiae bacterium]|nr:UDP-N-acetylglucosamine 2-epimerase (non-hydrolyzing) [Verrucomicrobiae bacterium]
MKKILCVVGTRPEAIKMAPVILALHEREDVQCHVLLTAQHRQLLDQALRVFNIQADTDLDIMTRGQTITDVTCHVLREMHVFLQDAKPDVVLAQGDTTTVMAAAMACFYANIPFGHVEAGLRTYDLQAPYPEEYNRRLAAVSATCHFAPTPLARMHLLQERIREETIFVTGNPVVDALRFIQKNTVMTDTVDITSPYVLMTCHRRESFGASVRKIFDAVAEFARRHPELTIWYPVHPNPNVRDPAREILGTIANICLTDPCDYISFVHAMAGAAFIITDSGGVQEEAVCLGKPTIVLREITERPEAVDCGICKLVGTSYMAILAELERLTTTYKDSSVEENPFGDGHAGTRIVNILCEGQILS